MCIYIYIYIYTYLAVVLASSMITASGVGLSCYVSSLGHVLSCCLAGWSARCLVGRWLVALACDMPNLPTNIIPTMIAWLKLSGKFLMGLGIPPLD